MLPTLRSAAMSVLAIVLVAVSTAASNTFAAADGKARGIERIERYLNELGTLQARFIQNNPDGTTAEGVLYLQRPGKVRFEYDPPVPLLLVANGKWLTHVDKELKQVSNYPLDETPAHLLLREDIVFGKDLKVVNFWRGERVLRIRLADVRNPDVGSVTLTFSEEPLELRTWVVTDAQGLQTELALLNARFGVTLDASLFEYTSTFNQSTD